METEKPNIKQKIIAKSNSMSDICFCVFFTVFFLVLSSISLWGCIITAYEENSPIMIIFGFFAWLFAVYIYCATIALVIRIIKGVPQANEVPKEEKDKASM